MAGYSTISLIKIISGLPFINISLSYKNKSIFLEEVLLDTGSAGTIVCADKVMELDIVAEPQDKLITIRGIGGSEFAFSKEIEKLSIGNISIDNFTIEVGAMDYGIKLDAIVGLDCLLQLKSVIDLDNLVLTKNI